ncbi:MAG: hypothetical protein DSZ30_03205 [Aquificaceae bacterium]|nr:MAG: hypothetical protein DSZ30_03205 [Aquificaceae bacterium]
MKEKTFAIWQVINGKTYFNQVFKTTPEGYSALKSLLLLPKKGEIIEGEFEFIKLVILRDRTTGKSFIFRNLVLNKNVKTTDVFKLENYSYNGIKANNIILKWFYTKVFKNPFKEGRIFEEYCAEFFEQKGYKVERNFLRNINDEGIDIVAYNNSELLLIQCKNWKNFYINHKVLKEFLANTFLFLSKRPYLVKKYKNRIRRILISSTYNLDASGFYFIKEHKKWIEFKVLKF